MDARSESRPQLRAGIERSLRRFGVLHHLHVIGMAADRDELDALSVHRNLVLMRELQAANALHGVGQESRVDVVNAIEREIVLDSDTAARSPGQALDMLILRKNAG